MNYLYAVRPNGHKCVANNKIDIIDSKLWEAVKKDYVQKNDWRILKLLIHGTEDPIHTKPEEGPSSPKEMARNSGG